MAVKSKSTRNQRTQLEPEHDNRDVAGAGWSPAELDFLDPPINPGPAFPVDLLPTQVAKLVGALAAIREVAIDYVACAVIGAASAAIGNRARILGFDARLEPLTLFIAMVGWPASGKGAAIGIARSVLMRIQDALIAAQSAQNGSRPRRLSNLAASFEETVARRLSYEGLSPEGDDDGATPMPGLLLSEYSVAGLIDELKGAPEGRTLLSDELTGPLSSASGLSGLKARALLLEAFDGQPYRKRLATQRMIEVPALQVGILGSTQPDRVSQLVGRARDGLVPRFLWCMPDIQLSPKLADGAGPIDELEAALARLVRIQPAYDERGFARPVSLAPQTRAPLEAAGAAWIHGQLQAEPMMRDILSRARQQAIRLSAVLGLLEHALSGQESVPETIEASDLARGIGLMDTYFVPMAERTFAIAEAPRESDAVRLARHLRRLGRSRISLRDDLYRAAGSPIRSPQAVAEAMAELKGRGLVREATRNPQARV